MKSAFTVVAAVFISALSLAQTASLSQSRRVHVMELEDIQREAMANNPEIRAAEARVAVAKARTPAAGALDDPMLMYRNWGTPISKPWDWNQAQHMVMYQQTLPGPGKRAARTELANQQAAESEAQIEVVKREIGVRVRKAYYDLLRSIDEHRIHDQQMELSKQALQSATVKYTVGRVPQQDVLKAQIAMTRLADHLVTLDEQEESARAELNTLMGRDPGAALQVMGQYGNPRALPNLDELERVALENRPELKAIAATGNVAESQLALARKAYTPDFTVAGGYMLMPEGAMFRNNYMAEVTISLPWLNRRKHDSEIKEAQTAAAVVRSEHNSQVNAAFLEIQQALIRAHAAERSLKLYRDTLRPQAEAALKSAAAAYQHDRTDFLNLVDSQNMLLDVESSYFKAAANLDTRVAELERAIGAPLTAASVATPVAEVK
ncbi:MAG TPA: TolC family protein [Terriglobales bacterium]|nr:TolC family protein [Terriglobales bacterium]